MDPKLRFVIVIVLGFVIAGGLAAVVALNIMGKPVDSVIVATVSTAVGALAGLLNPHNPGDGATTIVNNAAPPKTPAA